LFEIHSYENIWWNSKYLVYDAYNILNLISGQLFSERRSWTCL